MQGKDRTWIGHFTVTCRMPWPVNRLGVTMFSYKPSCFSHVNDYVHKLMRITWFAHEEQPSPSCSHFCLVTQCSDKTKLTARKTDSSLAFIQWPWHWAHIYTTVKWPNRRGQHVKKKNGHEITPRYLLVCLSPKFIVNNCVMTYYKINAVTDLLKWFTFKHFFPLIQKLSLEIILDKNTHCFPLKVNSARTVYIISDIQTLIHVYCLHCN